MVAFGGGRDDYVSWVVYANEVCAGVKILDGRPEMQSGGSRAANGMAQNHDCGAPPLAAALRATQHADV